MQIHSAVCVKGEDVFMCHNNKQADTIEKHEAWVNWQRKERENISKKQGREMYQYIC